MFVRATYLVHCWLVRLMQMCLPAHGPALHHCIRMDGCPAGGCAVDVYLGGQDVLMMCIVKHECGHSLLNAGSTLVWHSNTYMRSMPLVVSSSGMLVQPHCASTNNADCTPMTAQQLPAVPHVLYSLCCKAHPHFINTAAAQCANQDSCSHVTQLYIYGPYLWVLDVDVCSRLHSQCWNGSS